MKFLLNLLVVAFAIACGQQAKAAVYEAKTVTMFTILRDVPRSQFALIGETSDGYQVWSGTYPCKGGNYATWTVDSRMLSADEAAFNTNTKYALDVNLVNYVRSPRTVVTDSTNLYFIKVKSDTSADMFAWDGINTPDFLGEFRVEPKVSVATSGTVYINDRQNLKQTVTWQVNGLGTVSMNKVDIESSYDGGKTWQSVGVSDQLSGSIDVTLPIAKDSVRYRATAYANDKYRLLIEKDRYVSGETSSTDISNTSRIAYNARSVVMTVGVWGSDISMKLLGLSNDGCQVWACRNTTGKYRYTYWTIDGKRLTKYAHNDLYTNTLYHHLLPYSAWPWGIRDVPDGSQYIHFVKVYSQNAFDYFNWVGDTRFNAPGFHMPAKLSIRPMGSTIVKDDGNVTQKAMWSMSGINSMIIDRVVAEISCDSGVTWREAASVSVSEDGKTELNGVMTLAIPANATDINYRLVAYPKSEYSVVVENGRWSTDAADKTLSAFGADCSMTATSLHRDNYTDNTDAAKRTIAADVEWQTFVNAPDRFGFAEIQCSTDKGTTWTTTDTVAVATGAQTVKVPTGYTKYKFRLKAHPIDALDSVALMNPTSKPLALSTTYAPAIATLTAADGVQTDEYGKLVTVTVSYGLNDDLWQTRGKACLSYSYDGGQTWHQLNGFIPDRQGSRTVVVDASKHQCKLRLEVESVVDGKTNVCTQATDDIAF